MRPREEFIAKFLADNPKAKRADATKDLTERVRVRISQWGEEESFAEREVVHEYMKPS